MDVTYKVVQQQPGTVIDATGQAGPGVKITAQLASGTTFNVTVPQKLYSAEYAKAQLQAAANEYAEVDAAGGM